VGGTSLHLKRDDTIASETAWSLSGGGQAKSLLRPDWQVASEMPEDPYRWAPDVAFLGDPHTGVAAFFDGDWQKVGGTSLGAPAWAAAWTLIRQSAQQSGTPAKAAGPFLYGVANSADYANGFHDITTGSNGRYRAQAGWDAVTGWGTPDVAGLAQEATLPQTFP
jgi:kumamolisin